MVVGVLGGATCSQGILVTMATDLGQSLALGAAGVSSVFKNVFCAILAALYRAGTDEQCDSSKYRYGYDDRVNICLSVRCLYCFVP